MIIKLIWQDFLRNIVDIVMVAFIFYRIILLIKGTRAVQMLLGIALIALVTVLVKNFIHLKALSWLLENFWLAAVVILAITFQPELRKALAELGGEPLRRIFTTSELKLITEIMPAIREMVGKETGALIVFEQETGLKNIIETGVTLDALLSREIILNVFSPESALHDGAMVIRGARVVAAGCILPVSTNPSISRSLGTRHRAALGLSEISDAISVVISEHTGRISLAYGGKLEQSISVDDLQKCLMSIYAEKSRKTLLHKTEKHEPFYDKIKQNWQIKIIALILAFFLWLYVK